MYTHSRNSASKISLTESEENYCSLINTSMKLLLEIVDVIVDVYSLHKRGQRKLTLSICFKFQYP